MRAWCCCGHTLTLPPSGYRLCISNIEAHEGEVGKRNKFRQKHWLRCEVLATTKAHVTFLEVVPAKDLLLGILFSKFDEILLKKHLRFIRSVRPLQIMPNAKSSPSICSASQQEPPSSPAHEQLTSISKLTSRRGRTGHFQGQKVHGLDRRVFLVDTKSSVIPGNSIEVLKNS
jgi:hypothetical protein